MVLGWGSYLRDVAATVVRGSPIGIGVSVVDGAGAAVISDNLISGADRGSTDYGVSRLSSRAPP